jgi:hypothetical protein
MIPSANSESRDRPPPEKVEEAEDVAAAKLL